jgi:uncharacterized protein (TIGR02147 family)
MKPVIYEYHEYRKYLEDYFIFLKKEKKITAKKVAESLSISAAFLSMIVKGKRNLDENIMIELSNFFKLNNQELSFFGSLLILNDCDDQKERSLAYKKLTRFKEFKKLNDEELITHKYLDKWYYVAIREMSFLKDFKEDPRWIQKRLRVKIKAEEIKKALLFLKDNNMLGQERGHLDCSEGIYKLSLSKFHKQMFKVSGDSIEDIPREERQILGFTKSLNKKGQERAKAIIEKALKDLEAISDLDQSQDDEKELYHFHLVNIPLTGGKGE